MASLGSETTTIPHASEWDEAYSRVESYFRAHQIHNRILINRLVNKVINRSVQIVREDGGDPVVIAMGLADETMAAWFNRVLGQEGVGHHRLSIQGRLSLLMADVPNRWPEHLLANGPLPRELEESMRNCFLEAGPGFQFSNMTPRPIDLGPIASVAGETWATFQKWPLIRGLFWWTLFVLGLGLFFYLTR